MIGEDGIARQEIIKNVELALGDGSTVSVFLRGHNDPISVVRVHRNLAKVCLEGMGNAVHDVAYSAIPGAKYAPRGAGIINGIA